MRKKNKTSRSISLPHPQIQTARQVTGSPCWNILECLLHGGRPASFSSAQWISFKTTSEGFFKKAGQGLIWNSKWSVFFSILAASPLFLSLKNMNRKILSLLFLLYNKKKGPPIWPPSVATSPLLLLPLRFRRRMGMTGGSNRCGVASPWQRRSIKCHQLLCPQNCWKVFLCLKLPRPVKRTQRADMSPPGRNKRGYTWNL